MATVSAALRPETSTGRRATPSVEVGNSGPDPVIVHLSASDATGGLRFQAEAAATVQPGERRSLPVTVRAARRLRRPGRLPFAVTVDDGTGEPVVLHGALEPGRGLWRYGAAGLAALFVGSLLLFLAAGRSPAERPERLDLVAPGALPSEQVPATGPSPADPSTTAAAPGSGAPVVVAQAPTLPATIPPPAVVPLPIPTPAPPRPTTTVRVTTSTRPSTTTTVAGRVVEPPATKEELAAHLYRDWIEDNRANASTLATREVVDRLWSHDRRSGQEVDGPGEPCGQEGPEGCVRFRFTGCGDGDGRGIATLDVTGQEQDDLLAVEISFCA